MLVSHGCSGEYGPVACIVDLGRWSGWIVNSGKISYWAYYLLFNFYLL